MDKSLKKLILKNEALNQKYGEAPSFQAPNPSFAVTKEQADFSDSNNLKETMGEAIRRRIDNLVDNTIKKNMPDGSSEADFENAKKAIALAQDAGSFIGSIKAVKGAGKLAMDQAARMKRAKEMGFDVDTPLYHGTNENIVEFDPNKSKLKSPTNLAGDTLDRSSTFLTPETSFANQYARLNDDGSNVLKVVTNSKNKFDFDNSEHFNQIWDAVKNQFPEKPEKGKWLSQFLAKQGLKRGSWSVLETPEVSKAIRDAGFDAMYVKENGVKNLAVFDPSNIRSVNAAFDPKKANSKNILAGALGAMGLSQYLKEEK